MWRLDRDEELRLLDKLGYARASVGHAAALAEQLDLHALGPEALDPGFNVEVLARQLSRRRGVLKTVLLNQKVLAGLGEPLLGQLLTFDLRDMTFRKASIRRRPDCAVCGRCSGQKSPSPT